MIGEPSRVVYSMERVRKPTVKYNHHGLWGPDVGHVPLLVLQASTVAMNPVLERMCDDIQSQSKSECTDSRSLESWDPHPKFQSHGERNVWPPGWVDVLESAVPTSVPWTQIARRGCAKSLNEAWCNSGTLTQRA